MKQSPHLTAQRRSAGFSLIEGSIAIFVFASVLVSAGLAVANCMHTSVTGSQIDTARDAARSQLERITAWPDYTTVAAQFDQTSFAVAGLTSSRPLGAPAGLVSVDESQPDFVVVTVSVEWVGVDADRSVFFRTINSNRD